MNRKIHVLVVKPIPLIVDNQAPKVDKKKSAPAKMEPMRLSLEEELALLENDTRLDELLSRLEEGGKLNPEERKLILKKPLIASMR